MEPRAVSISDIAQETGSDVGQREELLTIVSGMFAAYGGGASGDFNVKTPREHGGNMVRAW